MDRRSYAVAILVAGAALVGPAGAWGQTNFGSSSAASGADLFIGQPANFYGPGAVYVYRADSQGAWSEAERLFAPDSALGDGFGRSLSASGELLLVGAPEHGEGGALYLFRRASGSGSPWQAVTSLSAPSVGSRFGHAVVFDGSEALVGAPAEGGSGAVYRVAIGDGSLEVTSVLRAASLPESGFGSDLSVEEDLLLVGAPGASGSAGAGVVYRRNAQGGWVEEAVLPADRSVGSDRGLLGASVLLVEGRALLGTPRGRGGAGTVVAFEQTDGGWRGAGQVASEGAGRGSGFGAALEAVSGELWIGAPNAGGGDGVVYRFTREPGGDWAPAGEIVPDSANTGAWPFGFGSSITAGEDVAVVGMPARDFGEGRAAILTSPGPGSWIESATVYGDVATAVSAIESGANCEGGSVQIFECNNVEVVSFTPVSELGGARGVWVNDVWGWTDPETGRDYALVSRRDGAAFVDLSDPAQPRLVGSLPRTEGSRPSVWRDIKVYGNHAFVVSDGAGAHGMQVFDLTRLRSATGEPVTFDEDAHYDRIFSAHNVVADTASGFLHIVGANGGGDTCGGGLHMVDVRSPKEPSFAGCYNDPTGPRARGYSHDAQCVVYRGPDTRYTGRQICVGSNEVEINIADVTDKDRPVPVGRASYPNVAYAHQGWFDETQRYFYMGDEGDEVAGLVDGTRTLVWDLAQLDDPILVREYIGPVEATDHNLFIRGDRAYMSNYGSGLRVLDISDPENPHEVAFFDSAPRGNNEAGMSSAQSGAWSNYPFFESGLVVFTSVREGLFVVRVTPRTLIP